MVDDESTVTLLDERMDAEGWSAEQVTLRLTAGGPLTLRADAGGRAVQLQIGEHVSRYRREYAVTDVDAVVRALPPGDPLDQLRRVLDVRPDDEGTTIIARFLEWLKRHGIAYTRTERTDL
ncbi:hypothetical protein [Polymorphospora rubra]|uniref:Uncharacterized protein n=1 Tax=Polymorphospora rubra TaxID=338584 RepID=A0A810N4J1_9ACTN|nr:hypothetical protein [Polymorphospora rubra]BCJ68641.1 hypothetical protein Prubr_56620 [Polymorphospora rubra]